MIFYKSEITHAKFPYVLNIHESLATGSSHYQDFYEFFITYSDSIIWHCNDKKVMLPSGSLVFVNQNDYHCLRPADWKPFKYVNLAFTNDEYFRVLDFLNLKRYRNIIEDKFRIIQLSSSQRDKWVKSIKKINDFGDESYEKKLRYCRVLLTRIISEILCNEEFINDAPLWLNDLIRWLERDQNRTLSLDEICAHAEKSREHLCRTMKRYMNTTPTAYLNDLRLKYAAATLETSDIPILELCLQAGFYSESYFNKLFKGKYGMTAGEYRRRNKI